MTLNDLNEFIDIQQTRGRGSFDVEIMVRGEEESTMMHYNDIDVDTENARVVFEIPKKPEQYKVKEFKNEDGDMTVFGMFERMKELIEMGLGNWDIKYNDSEYGNLAITTSSITIEALKGEIIIS